MTGHRSAQRSGHAPAPRSGQRGRRRAAARRRRRRLLVTIAVSLSVLVAMGGASAMVAFVKLNGNIASKDVSGLLGERPDGGTQQATNILLIGSDTRAGTDNGGYGKHVAGARSDTTVLLHLSKGHEKAALVSIPRDSYVDIPACEQADGSMSEPTTNRFNSAYSIGGTACTIKTVESLTDVFIDHYMVIDFSGFKRMVDAMGGVEVCVEEAVHDEKSKLDLPAGRSEVGGEQALAFARTRYSLGDGSDISRIGRQQALMSAMIRKVKSSDLLLNPKRLYGFLDAATKSLTTDPELASLNDLRRLATSVKGMNTGQVRFVTVPNTPNDDGATVSWNDTADALWKAIRSDSPLPGEAPSKRRKKPGRSAPLRVAPSEVQVTVLNGSGVPGLASVAADELTRAGFVVTGVANADAFDYRSSLVRHAGESEAARTLASAVPGAKVEQSPTAGRSLELVIGADYRGVQQVEAGQTPPEPSGAPSPTISARKANDTTCS